MNPALSSFLANFGFFAPAAAIGWWALKTMRADLIGERNTAQADLKAERDRNAALTDRVIVLAQSVERTMAELTAAIRGAGK